MVGVYPYPPPSDEGPYLHAIRLEYVPGTISGYTLRAANETTRLMDFLQSTASDILSAL